MFSGVPEEPPRRGHNTYSRPTGPLEFLEAQKRQYIDVALATNSHRTYNTAVTQYTRYCSQTNIRPIPLNNNTIESYVVHLAKRVGYKTIEAYLCGIQFHATIRGHHEKIADMPRLGLILRCIRRALGTKHTRPRREPITLAHLHRIYTHLELTHTLQNATMMKAAFTLAYFAMLRVSEYTSTTGRSFDKDCNLLMSDIYISGEIACIHIKSSKTDPFRTGVTLRIATTHHAICPLRYLRQYSSMRGLEEGPLFRHHNGAFLVRHDVAKVIKDCLKAPKLNTHSLRIGGASNLANIGVPDYAIQILGRWRSDAY